MIQYGIPRRRVAAVPVEFNIRTNAIRMDFQARRSQEAQERGMMKLMSEIARRQKHQFWRTG